MKLPHFLTILAVSLPFAAAPLVLRAADPAADCCTDAPVEATALLRKVELDAALKQYEKVLAAIGDLNIERAIAGAYPVQSELVQKEKDGERLAKLKALESVKAELRAEISHYVEAGNVAALPKIATKKTAAVPSVKVPDPSQPFQGSWEGAETGRNAQGVCTLTVKGYSLHFQGSNENEWYDATFTLPAGKTPSQLRATITNCPAPEFIGKSAAGIYQFEDGKLTLVANPPGMANAPAGFEGGADSRSFVFKKAPAQK